MVDPLAHVFLREVRQVPLPSGALGHLGQLVELENQRDFTPRGILKVSSFKGVLQL